MVKRNTPSGRTWSSIPGCSPPPGPRRERARYTDHADGQCLTNRLYGLKFGNIIRQLIDYKEAWERECAYVDGLDEQSVNVFVSRGLPKRNLIRG